MKTFFIIVLAAAVNLFAGSGSNYFLSSPDSQISVAFELGSDGSPLFSIYLSGAEILNQSSLGIIRSDDDFSSNMRLDSLSGVTLISDEYSLLHGKKPKCSYRANKRTAYLKNKNGNVLEIIFQLSNDGVAFRYSFPDSSIEKKEITKETTSYNFPEGTKTWIQPIAEAKSGWNRTNPSYEENYEQEIDVAKLRYHKPGWVYPALFNFSSIWMLISETAPYRDYCGTRLLHEDGSNEFTIGFPSQKETLNEKEGANPNSTLPWFTPWRIVAVGRDLSSIVESTLGTDLAKPSLLNDISFVKPGHASWSWVMLKDDSTIFNVQKRFIDYASDMGWEYCLIDAYWNKQIGYDSIKVLADYADTKNVGLLLWYNSAGSWNTAPLEPRDLMLTKESRDREFKRIKEIGIKGVKVDFFGGDGQDMMSYYLDIFEDAAKYGIMVNTHGCTLPRGWQRTYPNLVSMEAVKGEEFCTFAQENEDLQPTHSCMLPYTRNVFDPMDFTPVVFVEIPNIERVTTNSFELALSVIFLSGIQHYAETANGMKEVPLYIKECLRNIPAAWDETKFITGYPGKLVVIARRTGNTWYVAGINGENIGKELKIDLSFVNSTKGEIISDVSNRQTSLEIVNLSDDKYLKIPVLGNGGFVIKLIEADETQLN